MEKGLRSLLHSDYRKKNLKRSGLAFAMGFALLGGSVAFAASPPVVTAPNAKALDVNTVSVKGVEEHENRAVLFSDLYSEQTALAQAQTFATYTQLRTGWRFNSKLELYGVARFGADSRTLLDHGNSVYNDNYLFLGGGVDYLGPLTGVRLVFQTGASIDLTQKTNAGGFDARIGLVTFHELRPAGMGNFYSEIYTEALYIRRYQNLLASAQARFFYSGLDVSSALGKKVKFEPMVNLVTSMDSGGLDFNRFFEGRAGFRLAYRGPVDVLLIPYYALGSRFQGPIGKLGYQDFRGLLVVAKSF